MTIGLLTITHKNIGQEIYNTSCMIFGRYLTAYRHIGLETNFNLETLISQVETTITELDQGEGVLILTDIMGATPCNLGARFAKQQNVKLIAGLNLGMMLKVANENHLPLGQLCKKVTKAGHDCIIEI